MTAKLIRLSMVVTLLLGASLAGAQDFDAAAAAAKADLDKALTELATLQKQIADEKLPLAKKLGALEDEVVARRREFDKIQRLRGSKTFDLDNLKAEAKARRDENTYITSLLDEYNRAFETRIHISEVQEYKEQIAKAKFATEDVNLTAAEKFDHQVGLVKTSVERLQKLVGGDVFDGKALSPAGQLEKGKFVLVGPIAIFASEQSDQAGISELQLGTIEPSVIPIAPEYSAGIRQITTAKSGELPVDASLGSAIKIAGTKETLTQHMLKGGPVMVPILVLAGAAGLVSLFKWIQLAGVRRAKPEDLRTILDHLNKGDKDKAMEYAKSVRGPAGKLFQAAVEHVEDRKELIEEVMYEKILAAKPRLERLLAFVALTAATEPLLGLLGTVTGIIRTFKLITVFGTGDPKLLSSGISEALVTTEFGLYFAIPYLLIHAMLSRKVKGLLASMEQAAVGFINGLTKKG